MKEENKLDEFRANRHRLFIDLFQLEWTALNAVDLQHGIHMEGLILHGKISIGNLYAYLLLEKLVNALLLPLHLLSLLLCSHFKKKKKIITLPIFVPFVCGSWNCRWTKAHSLHFAAFVIVLCARGMNTTKECKIEYWFDVNACQSTNVRAWNNN